MRSEKRPTWLKGMTREELAEWLEERGGEPEQDRGAAPQSGRGTGRDHRGVTHRQPDADALRDDGATLTELADRELGERESGAAEPQHELPESGRHPNPPPR